MGFNPRLAPYTLSANFHMRVTSKDAANAHEFPLFRFPFAGQIVGGYANAVFIGASGAADLSVTATTNTGIQGMAFWKHATNDTTATYVTGLRALQRTGDKNSSTGGGINWRLVGLSGTPNGLHPFADNNTAAASRKRFNAGDGVILHVANYGVTNAHRNYEIYAQMDYIIGREA